jgi:hypothetical protein
VLLNIDNPVQREHRTELTNLNNLKHSAFNHMSVFTRQRGSKFFIWIWTRQYMSEEFGYKSASDILSDMLIVRNSLRQEPLYRNSLREQPPSLLERTRRQERFHVNSLRQQQPPSLDSKWDSTSQKSKLQLVNNNTQVYFDIDNFFEKIKNREEFVFLEYTLEPDPGVGAPIQSVTSSDDKLRTINKEIFDLCEHCLFAIDWTKYK